MFEFLLFGSMVWFWILFGVWSVVLLVSVEYDGAGWATLATLAFAATFSVWGVLPGGGNILALLTAQPLLVVAGVVAFFVLGTVWAVVKWWFFVNNLANKRREELAIGYRMGTTKPLVSDNKRRIMTWMCFWPYSFIWTIIDDPIRRVFKAIYRRIRVRLEKIADKAFEGLEDPETPERPTRREGEF